MSSMFANWLRHRWIRRASMALCTMALLLGVAVASHAAHLRRSAQALIASAKRIRSTADAEYAIAMWR